MDFSISNNFCQEILSAIDKIDRKINKNIIDHIEMSINFYEKIEDNILLITDRDKQLYMKIFAIPIEINGDMKEGYRVVYKDSKEVKYGI